MGATVGAGVGEGDGVGVGVGDAIGVPVTCSGAVNIVAAAATPKSAMPITTATIRKVLFDFTLDIVFCVMYFSPPFKESFEPLFPS